MKETCFKVLGKDITIPISVAMTENTTVHCEWSDRVLRTLAPVRMWKPISRILLARSMNPVHSYAIRVLPKTSYPKSPVWGNIVSFAEGKLRGRETYKYP
jgi:hypothetical protein